MPTAFMRSPADELQGITARDKLRRSRTRGGLLMEDRDQAVESILHDVKRNRNTGELRVTAQGTDKVRAGGQGSAPNQRVNRDIQTGSAEPHPQDTKTGAVGLEPNVRDEAGSVAAGSDSGPDVKV